MANQLFPSELIEAIGWTLVHSLWQGTLVALLLGFVLLLLRRNSAQLRYFLAFVSLLAMLGWSGVTFYKSYRYALEKKQLKENIISSPNYLKALLTQNIPNETQTVAPEESAFNLRMVKARSFFQRNFPWICTFWLAGMAFLILRLIGGFVYLRRLRTVGLVALSDEWMDKLTELAAKLNIRRKVQAFFSPLVKSPVTIGFIKPMILFPLSAFTGVSVKEVEAIIAHELAHILRHDYLFNILQSVMEIMFFYHPAVWAISAQIRTERENSCDNIAIGLTGDKVAYAKAIAMAEIFKMEQERLAMAFASKKGNSLQRIKRLQKNVAMKTNFIEGLIAAGVIVTGLTLASFTMRSNTSLDESATVKMGKTDSTEVVDIDSLLDSTNEKIKANSEIVNANKELEQALEVALSEQDTQQTAEMLEEINTAIADIHIEKVVEEAMVEVQKALEEANESVDKEQVRKDLAEAKRELEEARKEIAKERRQGRDEYRSEMEEARAEIEASRKEVIEELEKEMANATSDIEREGIRMGMQAATAGLNVASEILGSLPIEDIIESALSGVEAAFDAMADIDFDSIEQNAQQTVPNQEELNKQLKQQNKMLSDQQKELQKQMKELQKQLDSTRKEIDKQQKEARK